MMNLYQNTSILHELYETIEIFYFAENQISNLFKYL